jgi:hypothetical protein
MGQMATPKLTNLSRNSKATQIRWTLPNWRGDTEAPYFDVDHASSENPAWVKARLEWEKTDEGKRLIKMKVGTFKIDQLREVDLKLFAKHLIKGWGNVVDDDGKVIEYVANDVELIEAVLRSINSANFDDMREKARPEGAERTTAGLAGN